MSDWILSENSSNLHLESKKRFIDPGKLSVTSLVFLERQKVYVKILNAASEIIHIFLSFK